MASGSSKAQTAFVSAVLLLLLSAFATYTAIGRLLATQEWVMHSHEVQASVGDVESAVLRAGRSRGAYRSFGTDEFRREFEAAIPQLSGSLHTLQQMTRDDPRQQELCAQLEAVTAKRIALLQESVQLKQDSPQDEHGQAEIDRRGVALATEMTSITQQIRDEEKRLLEVRTKSAGRQFRLTVGILAAVLVLALGLLFLHYRFLSIELKARERAEKIARESEQSLRHLTGRLLQLQDAERRRFSRELHDSLGQYLTGVKMNLEMFVAQGKDDLLTEAIHLLDQSIAETRTISHLLHPPLLDEAGLASATKWYLEGFGKRSGIEVKLDLPTDLGRLPKSVEIGLFRVLQECLTNIHRHSESPKAEVVLQRFPDHVALQIRDFGKGIAVASSFSATNGKAVKYSGVGLAGIRERMIELGGTLSVERCSPGTLVTVSIPLFDEADDSDPSSVDATPSTT
jgi:signal transduction histidine kinase